MATAAVVGMLVLLSSAAASGAVPAARSVPVLFVFGDSLVDDGNNNALSCLAKANFFPYGIDFLHGAATGRFCNGNTFVDALCDLLGIDYLPPFATTTDMNGTSLLGGVNYASAAGGILDETGQHLGDRYSLSQQVINMESNLDTIRSQMELDHGGYDEYLARSIAVMVFGSNDYINNYLLTSLYDSGYSYSPEDYADLLINHYTRQILALYSVGLRKFLLSGVGPLGCIPRLIRASGLGPPGQCVDEVNQMVGFFNQGLRSLVDQLNADDPGAIFLYGNTYHAVYDMLNNPNKYGFTVVDSGCCVLGEDGTCEPYAEPCESRDQHVFWDAYHPTEAVNLVLAQRAFNGTHDHVYPLNLHQLADL